MGVKTKLLTALNQQRFTPNNELESSFFVTLISNPLTARDEPWPFFLFWCHHFWPKLASSILSFCRRKRSFQWRPDQSDRPNGALDMHKNAQKVEWKTRSKISGHYTWLLHAKNCLSRWCFLRSFLTTSSPVEGRSLQQKEEKRRKGKAKKNSKNLKRDAGGKKGKMLCCKQVFNRIEGNLAEIQPKMSKKHTFCKKFK